MKVGYKQTEVGVIPEDWDVKTVGDLFSVQLGKMLDAEKNTGVSRPYVGNKAVQWGRVDVEQLSNVKMSSADLRRYRLVVGDILVCEGGEVGRAAIWTSPIDECYYQKALHRLRPKSNFSKVIATALFQRYSENGFFKNFVTQTSIAHLPKEKFVEVPLPIPTPDEQKAIAGALSDVDGLIAGLEALIAKKRSLKTATMQQLLTGKTRLPGFGEVWSEATLGSISGFITKGATPTTYGHAWQPDGIPFLKSECVAKSGLDLEQVRYISDAAHAQLNRSEIRSGDLLITITGNVGRVVLLSEDFGAANINQHIARIRITDTHVDKRFVHHVLSQEHVRKHFETIVTGLAYPQISLVQVRNAIVPLPELKEQQQIADVLSDMDQAISSVEGELKKAKSLKQGMMQELLTGRTRLI